MPFRRIHSSIFPNAVPKPESARPKPQRQKWFIFPLIWRWFRRVLMTLGVITLMTSLLGAYSFLSVFEKSEPVTLPDAVILEIDLKNGLSEVQTAASLGSPFGGSQMLLRQVIGILDRAAADDRVKGVVVQCCGSNMGLGHIQELRTALQRFKDTGKTTAIYSPSYADTGLGISGYYLASVFDHIWMQPVGQVDITGLSLKMPFLRNVLDEFGVTPDFKQRKEYKTAVENLTNSRMSRANAQMTRSMLDSLSGQMLTDMAASRGYTERAFKTLIDDGLFTDREALSKKLVTHLGYYEDLKDTLKILGNDADCEDENAEKPRYVSLNRYAGGWVQERIDRSMNEIKGEQKAHKPKVAILYITGAIAQSEGVKVSPFGGEAIAAADDIVKELRRIEKDASLDAVVVRIDSPGGSPAASETIRHALTKIQNSGKTLYVSMGPTAASGGYWIAAPADKIYAMPATLTGSIGVVGGKFAINKLLAEWDVNVEGPEWGRNASLSSPYQPYTASESVQVDKMLDSIYKEFLVRVADGRGLPVDKVKEIARGRVWTGAQAKEVGLVDELGGLAETLEDLAAELGVDSRVDLDITIRPEIKTPLEQFLDLLRQGSMTSASMHRVAQTMEFLQPVLTTIDRAQNPGAYTLYYDSPF